jgi:hypothetical protein
MLLWLIESCCAKKAEGSSLTLRHSENIVTDRSHYISLIASLSINSPVGTSACVGTSIFLIFILFSFLCFPCYFLLPFYFLFLKMQILKKF